MYNIRIKMLGQFAILLNGEIEDQNVVRSRKGVALIKYLILNRGELVTRKRLFETLWPDESVGNPENALKTLVSRTRNAMDKACPGFSICLAARRGGYYWNEEPGVTVDLYEADRLLHYIYEEEEPALKSMERLLEIYDGKLIESEQYSWMIPHSTAIHNQYMNAMCRYIDALYRAYKYEETIRVCRKVLSIDEFDDRIHIALMNALLKLNRESEALRQYRRVKQLHFEYLGVSMSTDLQAFYKTIVSSGKKPVFDLNYIRDELIDDEGTTGVLNCDYVVFKEVYNLERTRPSHNLQKILAAISLEWKDNATADMVLLEEAMEYLMDMLQTKLNRGDMFTRFSASVVAMLLFPYENFSYPLLMEDIKHRFYEKYSKSGLIFNYQAGTIEDKPSPRKNENIRSKR